jgi:hypothetical protein
MAAALTPRVRMIAICEGVRKSKTEENVFHLKGVRQGISAKTLPFVAPHLWLFVLLSSPRIGEFPCYVRVINDRTNKAIFYAHVEPRPAFVAEGGMCASSARIRCSFPEEGRYTVEVWFFQEQDSDVLKGEMPFTVASQGDETMKKRSREKLPRITFQECELVEITDAAEQAALERRIRAAEKTMAAAEKALAALAESKKPVARKPK